MLHRALLSVPLLLAAACGGGGGDGDSPRHISFSAGPTSPVPIFTVYAAPHELLDIALGKTSGGTFPDLLSFHDGLDGMTRMLCENRAAGAGDGGFAAEQAGALAAGLAQKVAVRGARIFRQGGEHTPRVRLARHHRRGALHGGAGFGSAAEVSEREADDIMRASALPKALHGFKSCC